MTETQLQELKINKLTKTQFSALIDSEEVQDDEFYLVTDDTDVSNAVLYTSQTLTDEQQVQARDNIGAIGLVESQTNNGEYVIRNAINVDDVYQAAEIGTYSIGIGELSSEGMEYGVLLKDRVYFLGIGDDGSGNIYLSDGDLHLASSNKYGTLATEDDISSAISELPIPTTDAIDSQIDTKIAQLTIPTTSSIDTQIDTKIAQLTILDEDDVETIVDGRITELNIPTEDTIDSLINTKVGELDIPTEAEITSIANTSAQAKIDTLDIPTETEIETIAQGKVNAIPYASQSVKGFVRAYTTVESGKTVLNLWTE